MLPVFGSIDIQETYITKTQNFKVWYGGHAGKNAK